MALFGLGKKKESASPVTEPVVESRSPVDEVLKLRQQGLNNNQIVQALQRAGYKPHQVFDALTQADMMPAGPIQQEAEPEQYQYTEVQQPVYQPEESQPPQETYPAEGEKVEELVEAIIDEKWEELVKDINKIVDWKKSIETKIEVLEQRVNDLKASFETLQKGIVDKISDYDQSINDVGAELKAMEKVFQKVLPTMTENVSELSRIVKSAKEKEQKSTSFLPKGKKSVRDDK